jgi:hypothetical protein
MGPLIVSPAVVPHVKLEFLPYAMAVPASRSQSILVVGTNPNINSGPLVGGQVIFNGFIPGNCIDFFSFVIKISPFNP